MTWQLVAPTKSMLRARCVSYNLAQTSIHCVLLVPVQNNPARRQAALKKFSKNARLHFEEIKENEKVRI